jgi:predicted ester cyclase
VAANANKALIRRFVDEWLNLRNSEVLSEICSATFVFHWGALGEGVGAHRLAEKEDQIRAAFPDLHVQPEFTVADATFVVNRSIVTGTHQGAWFGVAPTGRRATWSAVEIYRIEHDLIAEQWLNEDWTSVLRQLELLGDP